MKTAKPEVTAKNVERARRAVMPLATELYGLSEAELHDTSSPLLLEMALPVFSQFARDYRNAFRAFYRAVFKQVITLEQQERFTELAQKYVELTTYSVYSQDSDMSQYRVTKFFEGVLNIGMRGADSEIATMHYKQFQQVGGWIPVNLAKNERMIQAYKTLGKLQVQLPKPLLSLRIEAFDQFLRPYMLVLSGALYVALADGFEQANTTVLRAQDEAYLTELVSDYSKFLALGQELTAAVEAHESAKTLVNA
jgi:hypothetical protein